MSSLSACHTTATQPSQAAQCALKLTHIHIHMWFCPRCLKSNFGEEPLDNGLPSRDSAHSPTSTQEQAGMGRCVGHGPSYLPCWRGGLGLAVGPAAAC